MRRIASLFTAAFGVTVAAVASVMLRD